MSRSLTSNALTKATSKTGTKPVLLVRVFWTGPQWYASEEVTVGDVHALGTVNRIGDLISQLKDHSIGTFSSIEISINDPIGTIKGIFDTQVMNGIKVEVWQHFEGNSFSDLTLMFSGFLADPAWSEGERRVSFTVESALNNKQVGFSVDDNTVSKNARKRMWPLAFGKPIKVPALRTECAARSQLTSTFNYTMNSFTVVDSTEFPSGQIKVIVGGIVFRGSFSGNTFTVSEANIPKYQSIGFGSRPVGDLDEHNPFVAWLGEFIPLANHYIKLQDQFGREFFLRVIKQETTKLYFDEQPYTSSGVPLLFDTTRVILEVTKQGRIGWTTKAIPQALDSREAKDGPINWVRARQSEFGSIILVPYNFQAGAEVREWNPDKPDVYVCNELASTVIAVHGMRNGIQQQIPNAYYTKHESYSYHGKTCTVLKFKYPLEILDQGWDDQIYVTLNNSTQGQNTAEQIKYLIDTYSSLESDTGTFAAVAFQVTNYPSNFALLSKRNVLDLVEDIAFQARLGLAYGLGKAYITYLSAEPGFTFNAGPGFAHYKSLTMSMTNRADVVTRFIGEWKLDGLDEEDRQIIHLENDTQFGLSERAVNFFIYNIESLVQKSVTFWGHRFANVWKRARTKRFMPGMQIQLFDKINYQISQLGPDIKGMVDNVHYIITERAFDIEVELGAKDGSQTLDSSYWMTDSESMPADPSAQYHEIFYEYQWSDSLSRLAELAKQSEVRVGYVDTMYDDGSGTLRPKFKDQQQPLNK